MGDVPMKKMAANKALQVTAHKAAKITPMEIIVWKTSTLSP